MQQNQEPLTFRKLSEDLTMDNVSILKDYPYLKNDLYDFSYDKMKIIQFLTKHMQKVYSSTPLDHTYLDAIYFTPISILASDIKQGESTYIDIMNYYYKLEKLTKCSVDRDKDVNKISNMINQIRSVLQFQSVRFKRDNSAIVKNTESILSEVPRESNFSSILKNENTIKTDGSENEPLLVKIFKGNFQIFCDNANTDNYQYKSLRDDIWYRPVMDLYCDPCKIIAFLRRIQMSTCLTDIGIVSLISIPIAVILDIKDEKCALIDLIDYYYNFELCGNVNTARIIKEYLIRNCKSLVDIDKIKTPHYPTIDDVFHKDDILVRFRIVTSSRKTPIGMVLNAKHNEAIITQLVPNRSGDTNQYQFLFGSKKFKETDNVIMTPMNITQNDDNGEYIIEIPYILDEKYIITWIGLKSYTQGCKLKVAHCVRANGAIGILIGWPFGVESLVSALLSGNMEFVLTIQLKEDMKSKEDN